MSDESSNRKVIFEKQGRIGIITLNNGEMNVFDEEQVKQMRDLIKELEDDEKIRVILIQGSGNRAFSSGFDLKHPNEEVYVNDGQEMIYRLYNLPKPTIALIHGYDIGIAFLVSMACDFRYATVDAQFSLPEINYEIMFTTHGGTSLVSKLIHPSDLKWILYTGERFPASKAAKMGLIDELFETKEEMSNAGMEFATLLSKKNPIIMACIKVALRENTYRDLKSGMAREMETIPFIKRPPSMNKKEQIDAAKKYIEKYTEKWDA